MTQEDISDRKPATIFPNKIICYFSAVGFSMIPVYHLSSICLFWLTNMCSDTKLTLLRDRSIKVRFIECWAYFKKIFCHVFFSYGLSSCDYHFFFGILFHNYRGLTKLFTWTLTLLIIIAEYLYFLEKKSW